MLREWVAGFDPELPIERGSTPPVAWYVEPDVHTLEERAVFRRTWQPVCRVDEVRHPGDFASGRLGSLPWVVVRGADGVLRALANVCRHKATEVCEGAGHAEHFTCPYHGWTYHLDGTLRSAPQVAGIQDLDRSAMALPPLSVDTWGPFVFVNADPAAPPLRRQVGALDAMLAATGWDGLTWHARRTYHLQCNWKVFCDNYLDGGYHVAHMHPSLAAQLDLGSYRTALHERFNVQTCGPDSERIGEGALYAWLYPNLMLNRYGPCLDTNHVLPTGPHTCLVHFDFFFDDTVDDAWKARSIAQADVTQGEDTWVSEKAQVGMQSGTWPRGRYAPRLEIGVHHFHRLLHADLRAALGGGS